MQTVRLYCSWFWVDVRLNVVEGQVLASADTPDGPSVGVGETPREAITAALGGFESAIAELLATAPPGVLDVRPHQARPAAH